MARFVDPTGPLGVCVRGSAHEYRGKRSWFYVRRDCSEMHLTCIDGWEEA